jgi:hypothetical protein
MAAKRTKKTVDEAVRNYLKDVSSTLGRGLGTAETSHYPALRTLLSCLGQRQAPKCSSLTHPHGIDGDFPDLALYEDESNVLVLPVEAKSIDKDLSVLAKSTQAARYAQSFGGGTVLVTNLYSWAVASIDPATKALIIVDAVVLVPKADIMAKMPKPIAGSCEKLALMVQSACVVKRGNLRDPEMVAKILAYHGTRMVEAINRIGASEYEALLLPLSKSFKDGLQIELPSDFLVPTVVQTLIYGLFAAWIESDEPHLFEWVGASYRLSMPLYADIVYAILTPAFVRKCDLPNILNSAAGALTWVDRPLFLNKFDGGAIEYFYEPFLAQFDPELRDKLGVWYTPREVADYQAARVDHHLRVDIKVGGLSSEDVIVLDLACGTGTYLCAVLRRIYETAIANGEPKTIAAEKCLRAATERVIGFEILPAAFLVSHLSVSRLLKQYGCELHDNHRLRIYLCNALTGWGASPKTPPPMPLPDLEAELKASLQVKASEPVIAILGNPPYQGYSAAQSDEEKQLLQPWVASLFVRFGIRKHRLGDLYVRFWRAAIQRIAFLTKRGVVCLITNRKWLGGRSYPLMRETVATKFQQIIVDDFHGDTRSFSLEESIFKTALSGGIKVGTAIVTSVKTDAVDIPLSSSIDVQIRDYSGKAQEIRAALTEYVAGKVAFIDGYHSISTNASRGWRFTESTNDFTPFDEYLEKTRSGVQPVRDEAVVDLDQDVLKERMKFYFEKKRSFDQVAKKYPGFGVKAKRYDGPKTREKLLDESAFDVNLVVRYCFRPFDNRWLYWEPHAKLLNEARREIQPLWLDHPEQRAIVVPQTARKPGASRPFVSSAVVCWAAAEPDARMIFKYQLDGGYTGALFDGTPGFHGKKLISNVSAEWIQAANALGVVGDELGDSDLTRGTGDIVFYALLAIGNSPKWADEQPGLQDDFPTLPLPNDKNDLIAAAKLGQGLETLYDVDHDVAGVTIGSIERGLSAIGVPDVVHADPIVNSPHYSEPDNKIIWDSDSGLGWKNVSLGVWNFSVAGFQVLPKWLTYRKNRTIDSREREAVTHICRRIASIIHIQAQCDGLYEKCKGDYLQTSSMTKYASPAMSGVSIPAASP